MRYKEMKYGITRSFEILCQGEYKGYQYYIVSLGTHPTAYVEIPKNHKFYEKDYDEIGEIDCHGGLTFSSDSLKGVKDNSWFIGWDYAHYGDYIGYELLMEIFPNQFSYEKEWTTKEIYDEVCDVINQLCEIDKNNKIKKE